VKITDPDSNCLVFWIQHKILNPTLSGSPTVLLKIVFFGKEGGGVEETQSEDLEKPSFFHGYPLHYDSWF